MPFPFLPRFVADKLTDIQPEQLHAHGIRLLMLDFDNTIVPYRVNEPPRETLDWFAKVRDAGIQICIVSNSRKPRVPAFCRMHGLDCITHARKPFSKGIRECLNRYGIPARQAALVGDQIYTDTLGANCTGVSPILVKAIHDHNFLLKSRHVLEVPFRYLARNRHI